MPDIKALLTNLNELDNQLDEIVSAEDLVVLKRIIQVADKFSQTSRRLSNAGFDTQSLDSTLKEIKDKADKILREFS